MLDRTQRIIVEAIKSQKYLIVELPTGDRVKVAGKKVAHDIALSIQDYFNNANKEW